MIVIAKSSGGILKVVNRLKLRLNHFIKVKKSIVTNSQKEKKKYWGQTLPWDGFESMRLDILFLSYVTYVIVGKVDEEKDN